jgi:hypothetical protein
LISLFIIKEVMTDKVDSAKLKALTISLFPLLMVFILIVASTILSSIL